jgi:hypothetical protein
MRHCKSPPIRGLPGQFEDSDEDSEDEDPYEDLRNEIAELKMKNNFYQVTLVRIPNSTSDVILWLSYLSCLVSKLHIMLLKMLPTILTSEMRINCYVKPLQEPSMQFYSL